MANNSVQEVAIAILKKKKKPVDFAVLWNEVAKHLELNETQKKSKTVKFYNALMLDTRFIQLEKNTWDLRSRHSYTATKIDLSKFETDDDDELLNVEEINDEIYERLETDSEEVY